MMTDLNAATRKYLLAEIAENRRRLTVRVTALRMIHRIRLRTFKYQDAGKWAQAERIIDRYYARLQQLNATVRRY